MEENAMNLGQGLPDLPEDLIEQGAVLATWPILIGAGVVFLLLIGLTYVGVRWRLRTGRGKRETGRLSPRREAEANLRALRDRASGLSAAAFAVDLSAIVRTYVDRVWGTSLRHQTTQEHRGRGEEGIRQLPSDAGEMLARFLEECDALKFQGGDVSSRDKDELWKRAGNPVARLPVGNAGTAAQQEAVAS